MISIEKNSQWEKFEKIYGHPDIIKRYYWFLFEFGKRATLLFQKNLGERIDKVIGDTEYKKRLMIAEVRDRGKLAWWAIVSSAKSLSGSEINPNETIFKVIPRFDISDNPVADVLEHWGPWTVDTIPFIPSSREAQVVALSSNKTAVEEIRAGIQRNWSKISAKMNLHGITFENRMAVYKKLKVVRDIEVDAMRYEFISGKSHWKPSLRWMRTQGVRRMEKEKDLIRNWIDPNFRKYRTFRHYRIKLTQAELKRIQNFQNKVRQGQ